jgi:hypothetical protein
LNLIYTVFAILFVSAILVRSGSPQTIRIDKSNGGLVSVEAVQDLVFCLDADRLSLDMRVRIISEAAYTTENIPIEVIFRNNGDKVVKLLNVFDLAISKKIFFSVTLRDGNGNPIFVAGGGKVSLSKDSMKYIKLKKGDEYATRINVKDFVPEDFSLKPGIYKVSVIYRNQYGEDCFKGSLEVIFWI